MGFGEILVILVIALLVFGPDRLPTMIKEAASFIRDLRTMVARARNDLGDSIGDLGIDKDDLAVLRELRDPKSFLRQKVLDGVDLGLDDEELEDATSIDSSRKPKSARKTAAANGSSPRAVTASAQDSASPNGTEPAAANGIEPSRTEPPETAAEPVPTPAPFDPDTT